MNRERDRYCPNCGRTVDKQNYHQKLHTCKFCDLNREGPN